MVLRISLTKWSSYPDMQLSSCLLYTSPSPRDRQKSRMPSSAWKKKENRKKKQFSFGGQAVGCSVACLGSLTIWLIKFSKPQTNHSKTLIKCVKKIVYYFIKIKLFVYNSTPIFSFLPFPVILSSVLLSSYSFSTSTMCFYVPSIPGVESHLKIWN